MALDMLNDLNKNWQATEFENQKAQQQNIDLIEQKIEMCLDQMLETTDKDLQARIKNRMNSLQQEKLKLQKQPENTRHLTKNFRTAVNKCRKLFESPDQLWLEGDENIRKSIPKMVFENDLTYCRKTGFRTASKALPFRVIDTLETGDFSMVGLTGIEPVTSAMSRQRSPAEL